jgi:hypothetical protein
MKKSNLPKGWFARRAARRARTVEFCERWEEPLAEDIDRQQLRQGRGLRHLVFREDRDSSVYYDSTREGDDV